MTPPRTRSIRAGFTLIELLCVMAIILVLAGLVLGPGVRVLKRLRNDQWCNKAEARLQSTVEQLQERLRGRQDFPPATLEPIRAEHLVGPLELDFLTDRRVTFTPFAASDPDDKVVIRVEIQRGYFSEITTEVVMKVMITNPP